MSHVQPPRLPVAAARTKPAKDRRTALTLNLVIPGGGQFYLGQRAAGVLFGGAFLACFVAMIAVFVVDFKNYFELALNGDILEAGRLEQMRDGFHWKSLFVLLAAGILIYVIALATMPAVAEPPEPEASPQNGEAPKS